MMTCQDPSAKWIWNNPTAASFAILQAVNFTKSYTVSVPTPVKIYLTVDDFAVVFINDQVITYSLPVSRIKIIDAIFNAGANTLRIMAMNTNQGAVSTFDFS